MAGEFDGMIGLRLPFLGVWAEWFRLKWDRLTLPRFGEERGWCRISSPRRIVNPHRIRMGRDVRLGPGSVLAACETFVAPDGTISRYTPEIVLGDGVVATAALQVHAAKSVIIEDRVLFASNVFICDCSHGYEKSHIAVMDQAYERLAAVRIGSGAWLGQNVVILPGVTIGRGCVIGANSVVTRSVPDYCIAAGAPAKVIRTAAERGVATEGGER